MKYKTLITILILLLSIISYSQDDLPEEKVFIDFFPIESFFEGEIEVELSSNGKEIYYTTNGSTPSKSSKKYTLPIKIKKNSVVRAIAYNSAGKSKEKVHSYFINEKSTEFAIVSISIDPHYLFSEDHGFFVGNSTPSGSKAVKRRANYWSKKEYPAHVEIIESDKRTVYNSGIGLRLFGGFSRMYRQKSISLTARKRYGKKSIDYPIFGKNGQSKFKNLVLRNSGSDWGKSQFRDALMTDLVKNWDIDIQDYRPSIVYINGEYWGLYNIREKLNKFYIKSHYRVDKDSIDLLEKRYHAKSGSNKDYLALLEYINKNDLSILGNYNYVSTKMDIDNFAKYIIAEIYFGNDDAGGNIKYWKKRKNGKWRWMLFDTDFGMGLHDSKAYRKNSIEFFTKPNGSKWPNPAWTTFMLRNLLKNDEFEQIFLNYFMDFLNTDLEEEKVVSTINYFENLYKNEILRHQKRWHLNKERWSKHIRIMKEFAQKRPKYMRKYLNEYFDLGELYTLSVNEVSNGRVIINNNIRVRNEFEGKYFEGNTISIIALPKQGFEFSHWEGIINDSQNFNLVISNNKNDISLKPIFIKAENPFAGRLIIDEISTNNHKSGDWIELYNVSSDTIDISNWVLADSKHKYNIPSGIIPPDGFLVIAQREKDFVSFYDTIEHIGNFGFGLGRRKETIKLYSDNGAMIDSVHYEVVSLDTSYTMELATPYADNSVSDNWVLIPGIGSPGIMNDYYVESKILEAKQYWMKQGILYGIFLIMGFLFWMKKEASRRKRAKTYSEKSYSHQVWRLTNFF